MTHYLKKFWKVNFLAVFFRTVCCCGNVLSNIFFMAMFQTIIDLDARGFLFWCIADIILWALINLFSSIQGVCQARAIRCMNNQLRDDMAATLLQKTHRDYHSQESGAYLSQFSNDVNQIEQLAWIPFYQMVKLAAQVIFSLMALCVLHWSLIVVSLIVAVLMMLAPKLFKKRMAALGAACTQTQEAATGQFKDLLAGCDVLRFFGKEQCFASGIHDASDEMESAKYNMSYKKTFIGNGLDYFAAICQLPVNALIGVLSIKGIIIQSALMGGGNLCGMVYNGLNHIATLRLSFAASKPYFDKITVRADEPQKQTATALAPLQDAITVENVSFRYDEKPVLQNASMRFEKGKKYALTGASGCGKSTLLKLLLGWLPDYTGKICVDGKDARTYTPEQLQQQMSYIEQNVFLFNTTIRENITLGEDFSEEAIQKAIEGSALTNDLAHMPNGLDTIVGEEGSNLSGGQKQRVAIARALIHDRGILLVDEGTSALDQKNADIVEKSLLANPDLTLILVSHHLTEERKKQFDQVYDMTA
jgi:ATP-binding cassette subfamily B protein